MTAREYLMQAEEAQARIEAHTTQLARLRLMQQRGERALGEDAALGQMEALKEEIRRDIERWVRVRREVSEAIDAVPQGNYRVLLEYRYLCGWDLKRVAMKMHYSVDRMWHLHSDALRKFRVPEEGQQAATGTDG